MARIKIELPNKFIFTTEIPIRITDINYGGHLGNDSLLSIIHEARVRFLKHLGYSESNVEGVGIIMIDAGVQYKSESFYGDILMIEIGVMDFSKIGCDIIYKISNPGSRKEIALAKTGIVFFDYKNKKIVSLPEKFKSKIVQETPLEKV
jgi:acyl-CoA thioester hydrolase